MFSFRAVAELTLLLAWAMGGFFGFGVLFPNRPDTDPSPLAEQAGLLSELNRFRVLEGVPPLSSEPRLASLVDRNVNLGLVGRALVEEQSALCQTADWVTLISTKGEALHEVLRSPTAVYSSGTLLNTLYSHVAVASSPGATDSTVVYRFLLCRAQHQ